MKVTGDALDVFDLAAVGSTLECTSAFASAFLSSRIPSSARMASRKYCTIFGSNDSCLLVADAGYSMESSESDVGSSDPSCRRRLGDDLGLFLGEDAGADLLEVEPRRGVLRFRSAGDVGDGADGSEDARMDLAAPREIRRFESLVR
jgi:hypothetical protein